MPEETTAGEGVTDEELVQQVADQTDSELEQKDYFERESDGIVSETEAAKADADEAGGN
jgi:protease I